MRDLAEDLWQHLTTVSEWIQRLKRRGWNIEVGLYEVCCTKDISKYRAKRELHNLEIPLDNVHLEKIDENEEVDTEAIRVEPVDPDSEDIDLGVDP